MRRKRLRTPPHDDAAEGMPNPPNESERDSGPIPLYNYPVGFEVIRNLPLSAPVVVNQMGATGHDL
jgi:hypothetical protein